MEKEPGYVYILTNPSFREDEIFATIRTIKYNEVEKLVHKTIDRLTDLRIRQNREFFNVAPQVALDIFKDIAQTIDDAVITEYKDNKPVEPGMEKACMENDGQEQGTKRSRFKFSMVGIGIGETVTFMPEDRRNTSNSYQGAKYFSYKGKVLDDLRKEKEGRE